ncbi:MAG: DEAD/DEAH box helicase [Flavobacteriales bacterium]
MTFLDLGISEGFNKGLLELGISNPTEIQEIAIPKLLNNRTDFIGQAQTGTGKTLAFGLPLLNQIETQRKEIQGLIICPTRELAKQVEKQLFKVTKYSERIFSEAIYGGVKIEQQIKALSRPTHIVVATPGRLIDLLNQNALSLNAVETVILDEADEMLSLGFEKQLHEILDNLPNVKSKWLFSATMPKGIQFMIDKHLDKDAPFIKINPKNVVNNQIEHQHYVTGNKYGTLKRFLRINPNQRGIVFCKTRMVTQEISERLTEDGFKAACIHGNMPQRDREKILRMFKKETFDLVVGTDVLARGIDISELDFVIHFQLPENEEYYAHRSGRTARAGKSGLSLSFITKKEEYAFQTMLKNLKLQSKALDSIN